MNNKKKKIVIVGATSAMAEHCARLWLAQSPVELILLGRDRQRLSRVAADLGVRSPEAEIKIIEADFVNPEKINLLVEQIISSGAIDIALIAHGSLSEQSACQADLQLCRDALEINGLSPVLYAEAFAAQMEGNNSGSLVLIGSVAGDRGRKSNYVYGAAKGLVTRYAQGLQHRFAGSGVKVVLVKPGPTDTPMTAYLKDTGAKLASVEAVAKQIVLGIESNKSVIYTPGKWWLIMMIIRHLPAVVFNKINI